MQSQILTWITFLPLLGMAVILFLPKTAMTAIKGVSVVATFIAMVLATKLYFVDFAHKSVAEIEASRGAVGHGPPALGEGPGSPVEEEVPAGGERRERRLREGDEQHTQQQHDVRQDAEGGAAFDHAEPSR